MKSMGWQAKISLEEGNQGGVWGISEKVDGWQLTVGSWQFKCDIQNKLQSQLINYYIHSMI